MQSFYYVRLSVLLDVTEQWSFSCSMITLSVMNTIFNYCSRLRELFQTSILGSLLQKIYDICKRGAIFAQVDTQSTFVWTINDCCMTFVVLRWDKKSCISAEGLYSTLFSCTIPNFVRYTWWLLIIYYFIAMNTMVTCFWICWTIHSF
jgi:hypothetical protein